MVILSNFADRLTEQMILHNLNSPQLAEILHVNRATISALKRGARLPSTEVLFSLVEYFNCSADYLLGLIEFAPENTVYMPPVQSFGTLFHNILKETNTSQYCLTKVHHISGNLLYQWLHDQAFPSVANLVKLSKCLDIPVDVLIGRIK